MRKFAVIGKSLKHSFSPEYFSRKFARAGISNVSYEAIEVESPEKLTVLLKENRLDGFNVTNPYKELILPFLDECDPVATEIGAVNCVKIVNGQSFGYNTDHIGFKSSLKPLLRGRSVKALVLGTGGASKAVCYVLGKLNIPFIMVSRDEGHGLTYNELTSAHVSDNLLIINCTPIGTWPDVEEKPDIPYHGLGYKNILFDLTYNPSVSAFLAEGQNKGALVRNGHEMLRIQAEKSWQIWNT